MQQSKQQGVALLSALLVMAICAALATFLLMAQRLVLNQANLVKGNDALSVALDGVQEWALDTLRKNKDIRKVSSLHRQFNGIELSGMIYALSGRFNVNSLQQTANLPRFVSLVHAVQPKLSDQQAKAIALSLSQWQQPKTQDEAYYLKQNPPYRPAHQHLTDLTELRLIHGVDASVYSTLAPYLAALPGANYQINVNYVSAPVLMSLGNLNASTAQSVLACRGKQFFTTVSDFMQQCGTSLKKDQSLLTVENPYYLLVAKAKLGEQQRVQKSLLVLRTVGGKTQAKIIWQEVDSE